VSIIPVHPRAGRPTSLAFTIDEGGRLDVTLAKVAAGVRSDGRCVERGRRRGPHCTRTLARRGVSRSLAAGPQRVRLPRLSAGIWTVAATVTDAAGNPSRARHLRIRVAG
jgi:hypothetical protein